MARQESDREDIMREATALVERAELRIAGQDEDLVVGFRREGAASLFFGQELVYHFNSQNELRRAYLDGDLIKADGGRLVRLRRVRTAEETQLQRSELTADEQRTQLGMLVALLKGLRTSIIAGNIAVVAAHPVGTGMLERIRNWLHQMPDSIAVADKPNVH